LRWEKVLCYWLLAVFSVLQLISGENSAGFKCREHIRMSVDTATIRRIAHLARIAVAEDEVEHLKGELNAMLAFVEQLLEVDVTGIAPMTSATPMVMKKRADVVTDGGIPDDILKNAPAAQDHFFLVPKVVE
jgi:aspartyl-tRNA(Asn)/glutamyl-tRNA(Gln) amidotransferase subunit C